jgi:hypothetical protein
MRAVHRPMLVGMRSAPSSLGALSTIPYVSSSICPPCLRTLESCTKSCFRISAASALSALSASSTSDPARLLSLVRRSTKAWCSLDASVVVSGLWSSQRSTPVSRRTTLAKRRCVMQYGSRAMPRPLRPAEARFGARRGESRIPRAALRGALGHARGDRVGVRSSAKPPYPHPNADPTKTARYGD